MPESCGRARCLMGAPVRWSTLNVQMSVNRWSTDAERDRLLGVLSEQGPARLVDALQRILVWATFEPPDSIGYDLHVARKFPGDDGGSG